MDRVDRLRPRAVELPVWPSYTLGGRRASKAAARNLGKPSALWYANTFSGWTNVGGNGAAMRLQPHVWASRDLDGVYMIDMLDVIADSVCTHGHPRAIVGACFHAATLGPATRLEADAMYTARRDFAWDWVRTDFGQTLLIKRRPDIKPREPGNDVPPTPPVAPTSTAGSRREPEHRGRRRAAHRTRRPEPGPGRTDRAIMDARENISDDAALGSVVRRVAQQGSLGDLLNFMRVIRDDLRR